MPKSAAAMEPGDFRFKNSDLRLKNSKPRGKECMHLDLQSTIICFCPDPLGDEGGLSELVPDGLGLIQLRKVLMPCRVAGQLDFLHPGG